MNITISQYVLFLLPANSSGITASLIQLPPRKKKRVSVRIISMLLKSITGILVKVGAWIYIHVDRLKYTGCCFYTVI